MGWNGCTGGWWGEGYMGPRQVSSQRTADLPAQPCKSEGQAVGCAVLTMHLQAGPWGTPAGITHTGHAYLTIGAVLLQVKRGGGGRGFGGGLGSGGGGREGGGGRLPELAATSKLPGQLAPSREVTPFWSAPAEGPRGCGEQEQASFPWAKAAGNTRQQSTLAGQGACYFMLAGTASCYQQCRTSVRGQASLPGDQDGTAGISDHPGMDGGAAGARILSIQPS